MTTSRSDLQLDVLDGMPPISGSHQKPAIPAGPHVGLPPPVTHAPIGADAVATQMFAIIECLHAGSTDQQRAWLDGIRTAIRLPNPQPRDQLENSKWLYHLSDQTAYLVGNKAHAIEMIGAHITSAIDITIMDGERTALLNRRTDTLINFLRVTHTMRSPDTQMAVVDLMHKMLTMEMIPRGRYGDAFGRLGVSLAIMAQTLFNKTLDARHNPLHKGYQLLRNAFGTGPFLHERKSSMPRAASTYLPSAARLAIMQALLPSIHQQSEARRPPSRHKARRRALAVGWPGGFAGAFGASALASVTGATLMGAIPIGATAGIVLGTTAYFASMRGGVRSSLMELLLGQLDTRRVAARGTAMRPPSGSTSSPRLDDADLLRGWTIVLTTFGHMNPGERKTVMRLLRQEDRNGTFNIHGADAAQLLDLALAMAAQHAHFTGAKDRASVRTLLVRLTDNLPDAPRDAHAAMTTAIAALAPIPSP